MQRYRLWLAEDHLLLVASTAIGERYKRFYFADIQSIVLRKTVGWIIVAVVCLVTAAIFVLIALINTEVAVRATFYGLAGVFVILGAIQFALGPTCASQIRTAVQTEDLPCLKRVRTARKILARIRPRIEAAQMPGLAAGEAPTGS
jgi:hypothetical protein